jgi:diguanylate cyclase (GGDEF)-like protein
LNQFATLFAQYGVEPFLESTSLFVILLDQEGNLLLWNPAFGSLKGTGSQKTKLQNFLASSSEESFRQLLLTTLDQRIRTMGMLEFVDSKANKKFLCYLIPLPGARVLFIAEPAASPTQLETVMIELERTKRILTIKETELKAVLAQAQEVSHTDTLTFLPNRRQILKDLQNEVIFSDKFGTPLSISMLDIDHFKKINDTYGHTVGDEVLRSLGSELRDHIRYPDSIGRYGGEEFLIVLPHSTSKGASEQAQRLCEHVRSLRIKSGEHEIAVTVSIGIAQYQVHKEDWQSLLKRADEALYQVKRSGRDGWAVGQPQ